MSFSFDFDASPPVADAAAFYAWNYAQEDNPPCAFVTPDGTGLQFHGSWSAPGRELEKFWPRLKAWADAAGVVLTFTGGDYHPEGFEAAPESDDWAGVFRKDA